MNTLNIIIPHYNRVDLCLGMLQSIYNDAPEGAVNLIVVDDRSTDDISAIKDLIAKNYGTLYINERKKGAGGSRNTGLEFLNADFDYTMHADSDDELLPGWYHIFQSAVSKNSDADIIYFKNDSDTLPHNALLEKYYDQQETKNACLDFGLRVIVPWGRVFKTSFLLRHHIWFDEVSKADDVNYGVNTFLKANKIALNKNKIYHYNVHDGNISANFTKKTWEDFKYVMYRKGDLVDAYLKQNNLKYRHYGTYLLKQGIEGKVGFKEMVSCIIGIKKNHMAILPSFSQLSSYLKKSK